MSTQTASADTLPYMFDRAAECMPRNELKALQLSRLKTDARARLSQCAALQEEVRCGERQAGRSQVARRPRALSLHGEVGPARQLSVRHVRRAARAASAPARLVGNHRQADRGRLHQRRSRSLGRPDGALLRLLPAQGPAISSTTPMATACSPAASARITAPSGSAARSCRCPAAAPSGRSRCCRTSAPTCCAPRRLTRSISPKSPRAWASISAICRCRSASSAPSRGPTPCAATSRRGSASRRSTSTACRRSSGRASPANAARCKTACTAGRTISCSRSSIPKPCSRSRWARPANWSSPR